MAKNGKCSISETSKFYMQTAHRYLANHYERLPVVAESNRGCWVTDLDGRRYLDMFADYSVHNFGRSRPRLVIALAKQAAKLAVCPGNVYNHVSVQCGKALAEFSGLPNARVLFMNTGAEAVEKAMKIVRKYGYEHKKIDESKNTAEIIFTETNFHGRTYGVLSASKVEKYRQGFGPFLPGMAWTKFGDAADLEKKINKNTVAFIVEPIQGEGGFIFPPDSYFKEVVKICRYHNVLLVLDEIPTAFGRTGYDFPHERDGIVPDMIILGKALGGGLMPLSAVVTRGEIMDVLAPGLDGSTFGGNPLACRVGWEVIKIMQNWPWAERSRQKGDYLMGMLKELDSPYIKEVRGRGLFIGVELYTEVSAWEVCKQLLQEEGVLTLSARQNVVRFTPPLVVTKAELEMAVRALHRVLDKRKIKPRTPPIAK